MRIDCAEGNLVLDTSWDTGGVDIRPLERVGMDTERQKATFAVDISIATP
jgi:hypothetical protein